MGLKRFMLTFDKLFNIFLILSLFFWMTEMIGPSNKEESEMRKLVWAIIVGSGAGFIIACTRM